MMYLVLTEALDRTFKICDARSPRPPARWTQAFGSHQTTTVALAVIVSPPEITALF